MLSRSTNLLLRSGFISQPAANFLARTTGLSNTERRAVINLINGMVIDGTWSLIDLLYMFATGLSTNAKLNLKSSSFNCTYNGTPSESAQFAAGKGYTGDGSTVFLNTGYVPSTAGLNYSLNSGSGGVYVLNNRTTTTFEADFGSFQAGFGNALWIMPLNTGNQAKIALNQPTGFPGFSPTTAQGMTSFSIQSASTQVALRNENIGGIQSISVTPVGLCSNSIFILGANLSGSLFNSAGQVIPTSDQVGAMFLGGGLTNAQLVSVNARINAYMKAVGANVY